MVPKSAIEVFVTVIEDDGGVVVAAAITAAGLALEDAGIQMFDMAVGSKVSLTKEEVVVAEVQDLIIPHQLHLVGV